MTGNTIKRAQSKGLSATACAITFQGNASNNRQQDAFFFIDDYYQETLGITEVKATSLPL